MVVGRSNVRLTVDKRAGERLEKEATEEIIRLQGSLVGWVYNTVPSTEQYSTGQACVRCPEHDPEEHTEHRRRRRWGGGGG